MGLYRQTDGWDVTKREGYIMKEGENEAVDELGIIQFADLLPLPQNNSVK